MNAEELRQARLRAICCPSGCIEKLYGRNCYAGLGWRAVRDSPPVSLLAAHDAVLRAAGIPIDELVNGTWQAVPKKETCSHKAYKGMYTHGRNCPSCGVFMVDYGD